MSAPSALTLGDLNMLLDAVMQRAGDSASDRDEDRWLELDCKVRRLRDRVAAEPCRCGHARRSHRTGRVVTRCLICQCQSFLADE